MPDYFWDRTIGAMLTLVGLRLAIRAYRRQTRRDQVRAAMVSYGRW
jgi:hypothetical protein